MRFPAGISRLISPQLPTKKSNRVMSGVDLMVVSTQSGTAWWWSPLKAYGVAEKSRAWGFDEGAASCATHANQRSALGRAT